MARSPPALVTLFLDALSTAISSKLGGACVYTCTSLAEIGARGVPVSTWEDVAQPAANTASEIVNLIRIAVFLSPRSRCSAPTLAGPRARPERRPARAPRHRLWSYAW